MDVGDGEVLHQAVDTCDGDLRRALTALQCCQRLLGKVTADGLIEVVLIKAEFLYSTIRIKKDNNKVLNNSDFR